MMRRLFLTAALSVAAALPAAAQQATIGTPVDPGMSYVGPFGPTASGGTPAFAQTFMRPTSAFDYLQGFSFYLGDNAPDASGVGLMFQAAIYAMNGGMLGNQLFLSSLQSASGNYSGFDQYQFTTSNLYLDPSIGTFAIVLQGVNNQNDALNVIAAGATDYANGALFVVNSDNSLSPAIDGTSDAAFDADFSVTATPEPATLVLLASGLTGVGGIVRRRKRSA